MPTSETFRQLRMVVGLGNPGVQYAGTRHNVGFLAVERLARRAGVSFEAQAKWQAKVAKDSEIFLVKPLTFMNLSGTAVAKVAQYYKIAPREMLVIYDDLDLPFGTLRIRAGGSCGGHNGMRSIAQTLGTTDIARVRIGIGRADTRADDAIGHVLGKFSAEERSELEKCLDRAELAVNHVRNHGLEAAMNQFNGVPVKTRERRNNRRPGKSEAHTENKTQTSGDEDTSVRPSGNTPPPPRAK
jgi:PTH1 family peptidyl-tRNA hydrolase